MRWRRFLETSSGADSYVALTWDTDRSYPDAALKIADCNRTISLYFDFSNEKTIRRARIKLNILRQALDKLEAIVSRYE